MPRRTSVCACQGPTASRVPVNVAPCPGTRAFRRLAAHIPSPTAGTRLHRPRRLRHDSRPNPSELHTALTADTPPHPSSRRFPTTAPLVGDLHFLPSTLLSSRACPPSVPAVLDADGVSGARSTAFSLRLRSADACAPLQRGQRSTTARR